MSHYLFEPSAIPAIPVKGEALLFPVRRFFCVGRNYAAHAAEMGDVADREAPWYFTKSATAYQPGGTTIAYPPGTDNFHYEMELVVALGLPVFRANPMTASAAIYAYGSGLDMTRRDIQQALRTKQRPWDLGKDCEQSAVVAKLTKSSEFGEPGPQRISLKVNDETRQDSRLSDMVWSVDAIISHLSGYYHLQPGDIVFTGTPAGVGPVRTGDRIVGSIEGLDDVELTIGEPA